MRLVSSIVIAVLLVGLPGAAGAAERPLARRIDAHMRALHAKGGFSGSVLVARGARVLYERAFGLASIEHRVPVTARTRFKIFSLTKPLTAVAVLRLVEQGRVALDDPIRKHLPECPPEWDAVRVEHLLSHTSGIPDFTNVWAEAWEGSNSDTLPLVLPKLADRALASEPGAAWRYSNTGYELLGCILERAGGKPYSELMRELIFGPLGMRDTGVEAPAPIPHQVYRGPVPVENLASGYNGMPGRPEVATSEMYKLMAAGGVYSTARDLLLFERALSDGRLLREDLRRRMEAPVMNNYGLGWVSRPRWGRPYLRHDGGTNGFMTTLDRYPDDGLTVIVLSNVGYADIGALRTSLAAMALGTDPAKV